MTVADRIAKIAEREKRTTLRLPRALELKDLDSDRIWAETQFVNDSRVPEKYVVAVGLCRFDGDNGETVRLTSAQARRLGGHLNKCADYLDQQGAKR